MLSVMLTYLADIYINNGHWCRYALGRVVRYECTYFLTHTAFSACLDLCFPSSKITSKATITLSLSCPFSPSSPQAFSPSPV